MKEKFKVFPDLEGWVKMTRLDLTSRRAWFVALLKSVVIVIAFVSAYLFRFDLTIPRDYWPHISHLVVPLVLIKLISFRRMGLHHGWWRYVSLIDVIDIFKANVVGSLVFILYVIFVHGLEGVPRSVLLLDGVLCFLLICGVRFVTRAYRENYFVMPGTRKDHLTQTLIFGAGSAGQMIVREVRQNQDLDKNIIGYIDDDPSKTGMKFQGVTVLGNRDQIELLLERGNIDEVVIAIPSASADKIREIYELCTSLDLKVKTLPGVSELLNGSVSINQVREVSLFDLLGRKPVHLDAKLINSYLEDKRVLVTGAGGSIGSEICRQVARFNPAKIVLFDNAETPLFHIERELVDKFPDLRLYAIMGDVRDRARVDGVFDEFQPEVVFHAAAYKHVPMMELNPAEAASNNVRGTRNVANASDAVRVERFVMISTDKAVNPTNVMGATKRAAELYVQALSERSKTQFVTVRFGNVLGSAGSVIPVFKEQVAAGGPVTVTDPEVTRFFMTIPEASQLVLQAGILGKGGEILVLDMGEPVKIVHLAEELIRLSGLEPYKDIDIVFTGLRPGEKLYEELLIDGEGVQPTSHKKICVARSMKVNEEKLNLQLEDLYQHARDIDLDGVCRLLREIVPEYTPADNAPRQRASSVKSDDRKVVPINSKLGT